MRRRYFTSEYSDDSTALLPVLALGDEIAQQLDIAKGSVTNIISDFRDGQISIPGDMKEYVNELRRIAVDLKKHQVSLNQLR